ncbi:MAG: hypothetical protein II060_03020, partial [Bacteroidales bacterium]|nr:hypothetical protein [Bacteroidales bacterium]
IDMLEIPGTSFSDVTVRYTFRMPEQENIWEYYNVFIQRLRTHIDAPFTTGPDGFSPDDNSQLYALREGLVNMLVHADYFSPMHSTIRVFTNRIEFQNPGRFMFDLSELRTQMHSMPRNPILVKLFRFAKLSENAGYGIDKMLTWEKLTSRKVDFSSDLVCSTVVYNRIIDDELCVSEGSQGQEDIQPPSPVVIIDSQKEPSNSTSDSTSNSISDSTSNSASNSTSNVSTQVINLLSILSDEMSVMAMMQRLGFTSRRMFIENYLAPAISAGFVEMTQPNSPKSPTQKYRLTKEGKSILSESKK